MDILKKELCEIAAALQPNDIKLIIGGGYGLVLRMESLQKNSVQTLMELPEIRSTNDLDIFLHTEIMVDAAKLGRIRAVLDERNYRVIESVKYLQFVREISTENFPLEIKIDFLTRKVIDKNIVGKVRQDERRVRYRNKNERDKVELHAHTTPEALTVEKYPTPLDISTDGQSFVYVYVPHPFSYLLLKLFAVRDCLSSANPYKQGKAGYHATDLYRIVASFTEEELATAEAIKRELINGAEEQQSVLQEAQQIVATLFNDLDAGALLKMRQSFSNEQKINAERFQQELVALLGGDLQ